MSQAENGYHLYDFRGTVLREEPIERFKQLSWRPRPPTLLSKDEIKKTRKNLREYSKGFDEQDQSRRDAGNKAVVEHRRRLLSEWQAWREEVVEELQGDAEEAGGAEGLKKLDDKGDGKGEVVEEIVEEIIDESEEIIP